MPIHGCLYVFKFPSMIVIIGSLVTNFACAKVTGYLPQFLTS